MQTAEKIKQLYQEATKDQPYHKKNSRTTDFLERFEVSVIGYIHGFDLPKKLSTERVRAAVEAQAKFAKHKGLSTGQYLQSIVELIEELKSDPYSPLYLNPNQEELF